MWTVPRETNSCWNTNPSANKPPQGFHPFAVRVALVTMLLSLTVLERFGINFGSYSLSPSLIAVFGMLVCAAAFKCLMLSRARLILYFACLSSSFASYWINSQYSHPDITSFQSLLLLMVIYAPFPFVMRDNALGPEPRSVALDYFLDICLFCSFAGIAQFFAQPFIHARWLFDYTPYLPKVLQGSGCYNTVIPVGSSFKSNGFFFLEPSGFSFVMALAILGEWSSRKRSWRLASYGLALLLSYSGTGILTLMIGMLFPLNSRVLGRTLALALVGAVIFLALGDALNLSFTLNRANEFRSERSSAYIRYVAPARLIYDTMSSDPWTAWLGHGPGTISREGLVAYEHFDPTWAKLLFEYGLLGFAPFIALIATVLRGSWKSSPIGPVLFISWLITGGHLLTPNHNVLSLALLGFWPKAGQVPPRREICGQRPPCRSPTAMRGVRERSAD
jgi:hypothetical protein